MQEADESYQAVFPHQARLRNLTYSVEMYVDVSVTKLQEIVGEEKKKLQEQYTNEGGVGLGTDNGEGRKYRILENLPSIKVFMGRAPVMIRSNFCHLKNMDDTDITKNAKECVFDQGGYFIINGSEKVIIANERMASNIVLVFHKKPPSKHSWVAEIRSQADNSNKPPLQFKVALSSKSNSQSTIECTISRIRDPIPVAILMRALGC
jgi:DNA-directed RNA polymerase II subunit RPB2